MLLLSIHVDRVVNFKSKGGNLLFWVMLPDRRLQKVMKLKQANFSASSKSHFRTFFLVSRSCQDEATQNKINMIRGDLWKEKKCPYIKQLVCVTAIFKHNRNKSRRNL